MGTPLCAGGKVFLIGTQVGIEIVVCGRADGGKTGGRVRIGMPIKKHAAQQRIEVAVVDTAQAKRKQRNLGHAVAFGHKVAALKLHRGPAF